MIDLGKVSIFIDRMSSIARALSALKVRSAVIDGKAISDFFTLHTALARKSARVPFSSP